MTPRHSGDDGNTIAEHVREVLDDVASRAGQAGSETIGAIFEADNLEVLGCLPDASVDLIYIDPPFNTGRVQTRRELKTTRTAANPDRVGFQGKGYKTQVVAAKSFDDRFDDYLAFLEPRLEQAHRVLRSTGSLFLHIDFREVHYCKLLLDQIFGRDAFVNEIIWAYDYGARSTKRWSPKHDNILWYARTTDGYTFNYDAIDRIPYLAPELVTKEKADRGKTVTDTWWNTIVSPTGKEKTGYPTQKPLAIIRRIIAVHSRPGDVVLDFFAGSGTVGAACATSGRHFILVDNNPVAVSVMAKRLSGSKPRLVQAAPSLKARAAPAALPARTEAVDVGRVHILLVGVSQYENSSLPRLAGPPEDLKRMEEVLLSPKLGLYTAKTVTVLAEATVDEVRRTLIEYANGRSAKGDILLFYFSGHGTVVPGTDFALCLKDTSLMPDSGSALPLSVVRFSDIVQTLAAADVHPVVILDACFSGTVGSGDPLRVTEGVHDEMHRHGGSSYAFVSSSYSASVSRDSPDGGVFTKALAEVVAAGIGRGDESRQQVLYLTDVLRPVQDLLEKQGHPLPRNYIGPTLPKFPLARNVGYKPRRERFQSYHRATIELIATRGQGGEVPLHEIDDQLGKSAYGNHSKLSLPPWDLVQDGRNSKYRRLTARGWKFVGGRLRIPEELELDSANEWQSVQGTKLIKMSDVSKAVAKSKSAKRG
jgi:site-specific DNA-methyltransferase (adenine-specific)